MGLSRTVGWLAAATAASAAVGQTPLDYRLPPTPAPAASLEVRTGCPAASSDADIVVCGTRDDDARYRVAPSQRPASPEDRAGGEQMAALADGADRCSPVGPNVQCAGGLDVIGILFTIVQAVARARANRD